MNPKCRHGRRTGPAEKELGQYNRLSEETRTSMTLAGLQAQMSRQKLASEF